MNTKLLLKLALPVIALLLLSGCYTLSLYPLYNDDHLYFDQQLVGVWGDTQNSDETWQFDKTDENSYRLVVRENGILRDDNNKLVQSIDSTRDGIFEIHLVKLNDIVFMDIYPEEPLIGNELIKSMVIPAHMFCKVDLKADTLKILTFDLEKYMEDNKQANLLKHESLDGVELLTASTEKLQQFMIDNANKAFFDEDTAYRLK